jgi:16S rRNA (cytosine967-C5)-methyltransferase
MGSRDRKLCSELVYAYYRLGKAIQCSIAERLKIAAYLCRVEHVDFLFEGQGDWNHHAFSSIEERMDVVKQHYPTFQADLLFPFQAELSKQLSATAFSASMLTKPRTYIRIENKQLAVVEIHLSAQAIPYQVESESCISFEPRVNLEEHLPANLSYEVQDLSSQETAKYFDAKEGEHWLDCCAASGGKSLLLHQQAKKLQITATDIRESILENYRLRMKKNGVVSFYTHVWDASGEKALPGVKQFDGIIADVPCSGSGTFGRHPEQNTFFDKQEIEKYQAKQIAIVRNIVRYLKKGGKLIYITCSVFEKENVAVSTYIQEELKLSLLEQSYLNGTERRSDSMFVARFQKG